MDKFLPGNWIGRVFLSLIIFLLAACQPTVIPPAFEKNVAVTPSVTGSVIQPASTLTATTTAVFIPSQKEDSTIPPTPVLPTPVPDPLRFVFPTPAPPPVSAWRPPLYPVPWAPTIYDHFYFTRPIAADEINWPSQNYRYGGEFFEDVIHTGVDIPAPEGTPVLAAGQGKVVWAGYGVYRGGNDPTDPYGLAVTIRHDFGYQDQPLYTVYGHMNQVDVAVGQHVETGDQLGLVGKTGRVTGPHLHFEVRLGNNDFYSTRNPELWLAPPIGWGILAGRLMDSNGQLIPQLPIIVTSLANNQNWFGRSYGLEAVNSDPYYQENLVIGDLPAGKYTLRVAYAGLYFTQEIEIQAGLVSYFNFYGKGGFELDSPPEQQESLDN
jgi:murein DD-endopeptidase MepM/ murein hydrolase activator NlpD